MSDRISDIYDKLWDPKEYLQEYYSTSVVASDEAANISFARRCFSAAGEPFARAIEVGCGPTLHHAMLLAPHVKTLDLADYIPANLAEVRKALDGAPGAHDWSVYLDGMAEIGEPSPDVLWDMVRERAGVLRQMDIRNPQMGSYDLVASYYTAECVAGTQEEWRRCLATLAGLVAPGGVLLLGVVRHCRAYHVCGHVFPATYVDEGDLAEALPALGFDPDTLLIEVAPVAEWVDQGFDSICTVWARKSVC